MKRRQRRTHHAPSHDRWLISYADFVTLLFALFIVLFASAYKDRRAVADVSDAVRQGLHEMESISPTMKSQSRITAPQRPLELRSAGIDVVALQRDLAHELGPEIAQKEVILRMTPEGFVISLRELGFFSSGQAELLPEAQEKIRRLARLLAPYGVNLRIEGHTDNIPIHTTRFASNWELSTARATAVARLLIGGGDVDPQHLAIAGYGEFHPIESNDAPEGRQTNRRVDIVLLAAASPAADPRP